MKQIGFIKRYGAFFLLVCLVSYNAAAYDNSGLETKVNSKISNQNGLTGILLQSGHRKSIDLLSTGDQLLVRNISQSIGFGGRNVNLSSFSGVLGLSSETGYVMVTEGQANVSDKTAKKGDILIFLPYGGKTILQKYDAERFLEAWPELAQKQSPAVFASLTDIADQQSAGVYWGRYEATAYNVSAPGSAEAESARRSIVGADIVQRIRFSGEEDPFEIERRVVFEYAKVLRQGNTKVIANLSDPVPFGGVDLRGGADGARLLKAKLVVQQENWQSIMSGVQFIQSKDKTYWELSKPDGKATLVLRPRGDFIYVTNVAWEARQ